MTLSKNIQWVTPQTPVHIFYLARPFVHWRWAAREKKESNRVFLQCFSCSSSYLTHFVIAHLFYKILYGHLLCAWHCCRSWRYVGKKTQTIKIIQKFCWSRLYSVFLWLSSNQQVGRTEGGSHRRKYWVDSEHGYWLRARLANIFQ